MNVAAILKGKGRAVATAPPDTQLQAIAERLSSRKIGAIIVVGAKGEVAGIISERDIIRAVASKGASCLDEPVSRYMTRQVVACSEGDVLDQIMATMTAGRFRHMPVMADDALVGIAPCGPTSSPADRRPRRPILGGRG